MNTNCIEQYYETVILPLYASEISFSSIVWKDHGKVGLDAWAHYFEDETGHEYVLLYEDFPSGEYLSDGLSHDIVTINNETSVQITSNPERIVDNLLGYFTLYTEKQQQRT